MTELNWVCLSFTSIKVMIMMTSHDKVSLSECMPLCIASVKKGTKKKYELSSRKKEKDKYLTYICVWNCGFLSNKLFKKEEGSTRQDLLYFFYNFWFLCFCDETFSFVQKESLKNIHSTGRWKDFIHSQTYYVLSCSHTELPRFFKAACRIKFIGIKSSNFFAN